MFWGQRGRSVLGKLFLFLVLGDVLCFSTILRIFVCLTIFRFYNLVFLSCFFNFSSVLLILFFGEVGTSQFLSVLLQLLIEVQLLGSLFLFSLLFFLFLPLEPFSFNFLFLENLTHISTCCATWATKFSCFVLQQKAGNFTVIELCCNVEACAT